MTNRLWQVQGNSQENQSYSYTEKYRTNTAVSPPVDITNYLVGGGDFTNWKPQQPTIIAAIRSNALNIISSRLYVSSISGQDNFQNSYGSDFNTWEADAKAFCLAYMAQPCFFCAITDLPRTASNAATQVNVEANRIEFNNRIRSWGNQYYHALIDIGQDPVYGTFPLAENATVDGIHWLEAVHTQLESVWFRPILDALPVKRRVVKIGS